MKRVYKRMLRDTAAMVFIIVGFTFICYQAIESLPAAECELTRSCK
jgi:hypothetical protein